MTKVDFAIVNCFVGNFIIINNLTNQVWGHINSFNYIKTVHNTSERAKSGRFRLLDTSQGWRGPGDQSRVIQAEIVIKKRRLVDLRGVWDSRDREMKRSWRSIKSNLSWGGDKESGDMLIWGVWDSRDGEVASAITEGTLVPLSKFIVITRFKSKESFEVWSDKSFIICEEASAISKGTLLSFS